MLLYYLDDTCLIPNLKPGLKRRRESGKKRENLLRQLEFKPKGYTSDNPSNSNGYSNSSKPPIEPLTLESRAEK